METIKTLRLRSLTVSRFYVVTIVMLFPFLGPAPVQTERGNTSARRQQQPSLYYRGKWDDWKRQTPEQVGIDAVLLEKAIEFAKASCSPQRRDPSDAAIFGIDGEPYGEIIGPTKERGEPNGLIPAARLHRGRRGRHQTCGYDRSA